MYKLYKRRFEIELNHFEYFLIKEETQSKNSGMPSSYKRYLIRFLVHCIEILEEDTMELVRLHIVENLGKLTHIPGYIQFNENENRFYNATLAKFNKYVQKS